MRITTLILAGSLAISLTGAAFAQGVPGGGGSGGNVGSGTAAKATMSKSKGMMGGKMKRHSKKMR